LGVRPAESELLHESTRCRWLAAPPCGFADERARTAYRTPPFLSLRTFFYPKWSPAQARSVTPRGGARRFCKESQQQVDSGVSDHGGVAGVVV
jgi:hypothetical protein